MPARQLKPRGRRRFKTSLFAAAATAAVAVLAGCGSSAVGTSAGTGAGTGTGTGSTNALGSLPASLAAQYAGSGESTAAATEYSAIKPTSTPWSICFEDGFEGNTTRIDIREELQHLSAVFQQAGKVSSFKYSVSNNNPTLENAQLHAFIQDKCSVILLTPSSTTGDIASIEAAYRAGIPVVGVDNYIPSPYVINLTNNIALVGQHLAQQIVTKLDGKGTVIFLEGIPGDSYTIQSDNAAMAVFKAHPAIKLIIANGNFAPASTSSAIQQVLATHPETINAVWSVGTEEWYTYEQFLQAHRPIPYITGLTASNILALIHADPSVGSKFFGLVGNATGMASSAFDIAVRLLDGQKPKIGTMILPPDYWSGTDISEYYQSCMTQSGESPLPPAETPTLTTADMNSYFADGSVVAPYDYKSTLLPVC